MQTSPQYELSPCSMRVGDLNLSINLAPLNQIGLLLKNPIMIASGTFGYDGYGRGIPESMDLSQIGAVIPKTVTRYPRVGNPEPRWYPKSYREAREKNEAIYLNSIGLANPGIEEALSDLAPIWQTWPATIILGLSGGSPSEFGKMAAMTKGVAGFQALELNLSCPNIESGALFAHSAEQTFQVVEQVKSNSNLPILVKLAPNVPDIVPIGKAAASGGADALTISNTNPAMLVETSSRRPVLGAGTGGLSGPALHPIALALVYQASQAIDIPIIGVGGVFSAEDALRFIMCGASAVQIGSANLADLWAPIKVLTELREHFEHNDIANFKEMIGITHNQIPV